MFNLFLRVYEMQPIRLEKAKPLVLAKSIKRMRIGLGWDVLQGNELDLDVTAVALLENGKFKLPKMFVSTVN